MRQSGTKMLAVSRFKTISKKEKRASVAESQCKLVRFQTQAIQKENVQLFNRFSLQSKYSHNKKTTKFLNNYIKEGQEKRSQIFKNLCSPFRQPVNRLSELKSSRKSTLRASQKQQIMNNLRSSINKPKMRNQKELNRKQKWIKQSFSNVIKDLKHRQKILVDKQNESNKNKIESYGSTIKGDKHNVNQDSIAFSQGIYIICDGHGTNGKQISEFVSQTAHKFFNDAFLQKKIDSHHIRNLLKKTQVELDISGIDISFSGCTFLGIIVFENSVYVISIGDSKAIMSHGITTSELNVLHKPEHPAERVRIQASGGIIHPIQIGKDRYAGPNRIWAPGKNSWGPGLALSRAFGDKAARKYGLISEPQIKNIRLTYQVDFILMGSDGLFDYMKDTELSFFVRNKLKEQQGSRELVAVELVEEAKRIAAAYSDDISCIIILL